MICDLSLLSVAEKGGRAVNRRRVIVTGLLSSLMLLSGCGDETPIEGSSPTPTPTPGSGVEWQNDYDILHLVQNITFLQAQFLSWSVYGGGVNAQLVEGLTKAGVVSGGRQAVIADAQVAAFAREVTFRKIVEVGTLKAVTLGPIGQPDIDISSAPGSAFTSFFTKAGVATSGGSFDPYADTFSWVLAALLLAELSLSVRRLYCSKVFDNPLRSALVDSMVREARAAGSLRTLLVEPGQSNSSSEEYLQRLDIALGLSPATQPAQGTPIDLVFTSADGTIPGLDAKKALTILYQAQASANRGGFFPTSIAGNLKKSG